VSLCVHTTSGPDGVVSCRLIVEHVVLAPGCGCLCRLKVVVQKVVVQKSCSLRSDGPAQQCVQCMCSTLQFLLPLYMGSVSDTLGPQAWCWLIMIMTFSGRTQIRRRRCGFESLLVPPLRLRGSVGVCVCRTWRSCVVGTAFSFVAAICTSRWA
jgi:hypothetical protein